VGVLCVWCACSACVSFQYVFCVVGVIMGASVFVLCRCDVECEMCVCVCVVCVWFVLWCVFVVFVVYAVCVMCFLLVVSGLRDVCCVCVRVWCV